MIKILLHYDCFNKNSRCLHITPFEGNFKSVCVFLHGYELFQTSLCSFLLQVDSVAADILGLAVADGFGWLWLVSSSFRWLWVVSDGFG